MKHKPKVYPEHRCISCNRMTTNKSYCDVCTGMLMKLAYTPPSLNITAPLEKVLWRRRENVNKEVAS